MLKNLIEECWEITKSKGFRIDQHCSQIMLISSECAEALEHCTPSSNNDLNKFLVRFIKLMQEFEEYRKDVQGFVDDSVVLDRHVDKHLEELADIQIRLCSYVGGLNLTDKFLVALRAKMEKNKERPMRHNKAF